MCIAKLLHQPVLLTGPAQERSGTGIRQAFLFEVGLGNAVGSAHALGQQHCSVGANCEMSSCL